MSSDNDEFRDERFQAGHGIEDPFDDRSDLEDVHERLDTFEHYIDHVHKRLDYLEDHIEDTGKETENIIVEDIERQKEEIVQYTEERIGSLERELTHETEEIQYELDKMNGHLIEVEYSEYDKVESELESLEYDIESIYQVLDEIQDEQLTSSEVTRRLNLGLHAPVLVTSGIASAAVGIGLLMNGSLISISLIGLSLFLIYTAHDISQSYDKKLTGII